MDNYRSNLEIDLSKKIDIIMQKLTNIEKILNSNKFTLNHIYPECNNNLQKMHWFEE